MPMLRMSRAAAKTKSNKTRSKSKVASRAVKMSRAKGRPATAPEPLSEHERDALALQSINENLYDWDLVNNTVYFAPGLHEILGLTPRQLKTPKDWADRIHPDDQPLFKYTLGQHLKGNTPRFSMELRYRD